MASGVYNRGLKELISGTTVWGSSTLKVMLVKNTYAFDRDHSVVSDIVSHELTSTNYARKTVTTPTSSQDDSADAAFLDSADLQWGSPAIAAGQTVGFAVVFRDSGADATSPLLFCYDVLDEDPAGVTYRLVWHSSGMAKAVSAT
jgi:hypothetical protein